MMQQLVLSFINISLLAINQVFSQRISTVKSYNTTVANGNTCFKTTRSLNFENPLLKKILLYPNPSSGIVGIKFVNIPAGKLNVQTIHVQRQTVVQNELVMRGTEHKQKAVLQSGMYWMKIKDCKQL
jgi:hypothetical protein